MTKTTQGVVKVHDVTSQRKKSSAKWTSYHINIQQIPKIKIKHWKSMSRAFHQVHRPNFYFSSCWWGNIEDEQYYFQVQNGENHYIFLLHWPWRLIFGYVKQLRVLCLWTQKNNKFLRFRVPQHLFLHFWAHLCLDPR